MSSASILAAAESCWESTQGLETRVRRLSLKWAITITWESFNIASQVFPKVIAVRAEGTKLDYGPQVLLLS